MKCFLYYVIYILWISFIFDFVSSLSCENENAQSINWFINYKLPKMYNANNRKYLSEGTAYSYIVPDHPGTWKYSSQSISSNSSMLAKTLQSFFDNKKKFTYLLYNDEPPEGYQAAGNGHLKGILVFNKESGFWIVHSVPKFSREDYFEYPHNAVDYGQSILCVSFKTTSLKEICKQLLYCDPDIYSRHLSDEVRLFLDNDTVSLFEGKPKFVRKPPFTSTIVLKSADGQVSFKHFAKNKKFRNDIYSSLIAPDLQSTLYTETWRRGSGTYLPPTCNQSNQVLDISSIQILNSIKFSSTDDHSKWAVSKNGTQEPWVCVGDMNRMLSQEKRGGGSLCFQSTQVARAYQSLVSASDHC